MDSNTIDIEVIVDKDSITGKSFDLLFNINNKAGDIDIKNTYIIPIDPKGTPLIIANFILLIKTGESIEPLTLEWNKLGIDNNKINEIQFVFVSKEKVNIASNIININ